MTTYNTGAVNSASGATSVAVDLPAGVLADDVMLMALTVFTEDVSAPTIAFSGAGGNWTLIPLSSGTNPALSSSGGIFSYFFGYYRVATAGDIGATLTITETGSPAATTWLAVDVETWTGGDTGAPIDVAASNATAGASANSITTPSIKTGVAGDWGIELFGGGTGSGGVLTPAATSRHTVTSAVGMSAAISDSNGSAGAAGSSIGGGTFTSSAAAGSCWLGSMTVGLAPAPPPSAGGGGSWLLDFILEA